ncbi:unnamed protein product [Arctogadus glacialis]
MDAKSFYGARQRTLLALAPERPEDSDADQSDIDDPIEDPDYHPTPAEVAGDSPFESLEEEEAPSTCSSTTQPPRKKKQKRKSALKTVSLEEGDTPDPSSPSGPNKGK